MGSKKLPKTSQRVGFKVVKGKVETKVTRKPKGVVGKIVDKGLKGMGK